MAIKFVFFDVGETLIDETRLRDGWADYLGADRAAFAAALEELIAREEHYRGIFHRFRPGFDAAAARRERAARRDTHMLDARDVYPDALPCLARLREAGLTVGAIGNMAVEHEELIRPHVDFVSSSERIAVAKPAAGFFAHVAELAGVEPARIAYVGDRVDNDVIPALAAGMVAVHIRRGPWGHLQEPPAGAIRIHSLDELPEVLA